jgi:two-component system sensor histidine kinase GlrK
LLVVTQQRLLTIVDLVSDIRDQRLSTLDAEEGLHRSAWAIEVSMRQAHRTCQEPGGEEAVRTKLSQARKALADGMAEPAVAPPRLQAAVTGYLRLADDALSAPTCEFLLASGNDARRLALDEELTNAWIDQLHVLHSEIEIREDDAHRVAVMTAAFGVAGCVIAAMAAVVIARGTARSVTEPIARLARHATRVGDGDFRPIPTESGSPEIEELWQDLERMRTKLLASENLKQVFLASVSHELRSPLAKLREAIALLDDGTLGKLTDRQARVVRLAGRACEQEVRIVEALLDMSRLRSGQPLRANPGASIDPILRAAVDGERAAADERGVGLDVVMEGETPPLSADAALVERAVANLVRNAVSVSPKGGRVRIRRAVDAHCVDIVVEDEGPGLPRSARDTIFQPFTAADVRGASRPAGIGLGLSLAREVARAHRGDLSLERSDEKGTVFRMRLPTQGNSA